MKKKFDCGHKGFGKFCHNCADKALKNNDTKAIKVIQEIKNGELSKFERYVKEELYPFCVDEVGGKKNYAQMYRNGCINVQVRMVKKLPFSVKEELVQVSFFNKRDLEERINRLFYLGYRVLGTY